MREAFLNTEPDFNERAVADRISFRRGVIMTEEDADFMYKWRAELISDRLIEWIDENPTKVNQTSVQAKVNEFDQLEFEQLLGEETAEIIPFPGRRALPTSKNLSFIDDATVRVSMLKAANNEPLWVSPNDSMIEAVTIMLQHDFSQLPVMVRREVKGVVSWHSIGAWLLRGGTRYAQVRECLAPPPCILSNDTPLFQAVDEVAKHQYVLIYERKLNKIIGIVTAADLAIELRHLSEPFLLLKEVENHIRGLISESGFTIQDLRAAADTSDATRTVNDLDDLTLGEYLRLLSQKDAWPKLRLPLDQRRFNKQLDEVRRIRNNTMHFKLEPLSDRDLEMLRGCASFLRSAKTIKNFLSLV
jgi:predicted transcriptional regulator